VDLEVIEPDVEHFDANDVRRMRPKPNRAIAFKVFERDRVLLKRGFEPAERFAIPALTPELSIACEKIPSTFWKISKAFHPATVDRLWR
jgi:hypothetical protein